MILRTLIISDSPVHRFLLEKMVVGHSKLHLVAAFEKAQKAKQYLKGSRIDLLFLDVELQHTNAFDFLNSLADPPMTILTTGKADDAVRAFEYDIVYYLLKPFSLSSFNTSIERARARYACIRRANTENEAYILVKIDHRPRRVFYRTIRWIQGLGDYIKIVTDDGAFIQRTTLKGLADTLPDNQFLRIHKSYIVNLTKIDKFNSRMVEIENTPIPISSKKRLELDKALTV